MTNHLASKCLACSVPIPPRKGTLRKIGRRTLAICHGCKRGQQ